MKSFSVILIVLFALALVPACEDDPAQPQNNQSAQTFQALTTREAVLNNIEVSWTTRNADKIDELLDEDFTFVLRPGDVRPGLPGQWDRADEMQATTSLFKSDTSTTGPVVRSIRLDIQFDDETVWEPVTHFTAQAAAETWYTATVFYTFTLEVEPDETYVAYPGSQAKFAVREIGTANGAEWRLVEWRDDVPVRLNATTSVSETTWGAMKSLFLDTGFEPLTSKEAVLNNIESAYNERRPDVFGLLLNANFTFFFAPGDVGGAIPAQWDRASELSATTRWLSSHQQPPPPLDPVCTSILVDLQYNPDTIQWVELIPEDFPTETWYTTTVFYSFVFEFEPDITYISAPGSKAQFTVRPSGSGWQLVEWRDLGSYLRGSSPSAAVAATWGSVKALYR
ncbi:MAG: hypothetical protein L0Z51_00260 [Candidatus Latescibacteria bacterium]|nr:hypothetical protein [Candidatus Latescibacterota bacterium]